MNIFLRFYGVGFNFDCFPWYWRFAWLLFVQAVLCLAFNRPRDTQEHISGIKLLQNISITSHNNLQLNWTPEIVEDFLKQRDTWLAFTIILGIIFLVIVLLFIFLRQVERFENISSLIFQNLTENSDCHCPDRARIQGCGSNVLKSLLPNHPLPPTAGKINNMLCFSSDKYL